VAHADPDLELLRLAAEFCDLEEVQKRLCWTTDDMDRRPGRRAATVEFNRACSRQGEIGEAIVEAAPTTLEGFRAKARAAVAWYGGSGITDGMGGDIAWALLNDLAARVASGRRRRNPDAALLAACAKYQAAFTHQETLTDPSDEAGDKACAATTRAFARVVALEPQTPEGRVAKARAAYTELMWTITPCPGVAWREQGAATPAIQLAVEALAAVAGIALP
jgi:hypothetical protein